MHPMIMITARESGLVYANGVYLGEVRPEAPLFRPVSPFGAVAIEFHPFRPMTLCGILRIAFSAGKPVAESILPENSACVVQWPFGITEIALSPLCIHACAPMVKTLTGAGRTFRFIRTAALSHLETEFQGRVHLHSLPDGANEPVFAEGEGVLYVSGQREAGDRYALVLTQTAEHVLLSATGREITFLPAGKIRVLRDAGDLAGHEREEIHAPRDHAYILESMQYLKNPGGEFRAVTPAECALCTAQAVILNLEDELPAYLAPAFQWDGETRRLIADCESASPLRFTPPDGRSAIAVLQKADRSLTVAHPVYYKSEMIDGMWKIIDMKAW